VVVSLWVLGCGPGETSIGGSGGGAATGGGSGGAGGGGGGTGGSGGSGGSGGTGGGGATVPTGCEGQPVGCFSVYAHSDHVLYVINFQTKGLTRIGPFNAPQVGGSEDVITDLAVHPNGTLYVVSQTALYTADPNDGHVTRLGALSACGQDNVALTFTPDQKLYVADFKGQFCRIDYAVNPPVVTPVAKLSQNMAISGDLVAIKDGTLFGTAYDLADGSSQGTQLNNVLVRINPATAAVTKVGAIGFPRLYGAAYALGQVFAFTHDGSGRVVQINPQTGAGTLFNTFSDPTTNTPIRFAGAGVNALVPATIN
jgi:hypothetical protein